MTSKVKYLGNLRTECTHLKSNSSFFTDAPTDNNGKGEAFSPTDTIATALASCMLTVMGIKANVLEINLENSNAEVKKIMSSNPRRISKIVILMNINAFVSDEIKFVLEKTAKTCPVYQSLHPEIEKEITFNWKKNSI